MIFIYYILLSNALDKIAFIHFLGTLNSLSPSNFAISRVRLVVRFAFVVVGLVDF